MKLITALISAVAIMNAVTAQSAADCVKPSLYQNPTWWGQNTDKCCAINYNNKKWWTANFAQFCVKNPGAVLSIKQYSGTADNGFGETYFTSNFAITRMVRYTSGENAILDRRIFKVYDIVTAKEISNLPGLSEFDRLANISPKEDRKLLQDMDHLFIVDKTNVTIFKASAASIVKQITLNLQRVGEKVDRITVRNSQVYFVGYITDENWVNTNVFYQYDLTTGKLVASKKLDQRNYIFGFSTDGAQIYTINDNGGFWKLTSSRISDSGKIGKVPIDDSMTYFNTGQYDGTSELVCSQTTCYATFTDGNDMSGVQLVSIDIKNPGSAFKAQNITAKSKDGPNYFLSALKTAVSKTGFYVFLQESKMVDIGDPAAGFSFFQYIPLASYLYKFDFNGNFVKSYDMTYQNVTMKNFAISDDEKYMWRSNIEMQYTKPETLYVQKVQL